MSTTRARKTARPMTPPTPADIIAARKAAGLTQTQAAHLVHGTLRAWQGWEAPDSQPGARRMHPGLWELFRLKTVICKDQKSA